MGILYYYSRKLLLCLNIKHYFSLYFKVTKISFNYHKLKLKSEEANNFYNVAKFPRFIGLIDCTHIKIQSLGN